MVLDLLPAFGAGMLVLADRNFLSHTLVRDVLATGAHIGVADLGASTRRASPLPAAIQMSATRIRRLTCHAAGSRNWASGRAGRSDIVP